jgi:hypothetical protein
MDVFWQLDGCHNESNVFLEKVGNDGEVEGTNCKSFYFLPDQILAPHMGETRIQSP